MRHLCSSVDFSVIIFGKEWTVLGANCVNSWLFVLEFKCTFPALQKPRKYNIVNRIFSGRSEESY